MGSRVLDTAAMQCLALFEQKTGVGAKDCIIQEHTITFIVNNAEAGKAIGKHGEHVHRLERDLGRRIRIVPFDENPCVFARNLVAPLELSGAEEGDGVITLSAKDLKTRGMLIGRNASHLRAFESIIQRYFPVKELRVE